MRKFTIHSRKVVFSKGPVTLVDCEVSTLGGKRLSRQILEHLGAVVIIPKTAKGKYILVRQFRFAAKDWLWEFPAGGLERGENLVNAAKRELMEEVGYYPKKIRKLTEFYPTPGICGEVMYLYLAESLIPRRAVQDDDEEIETGEFTLKEIGQMIRRKKIRDAKTMIGYFCLLNPRAFA